MITIMEKTGWKLSQLSVGMSASSTRTPTDNAVWAFADASGDHNLIHLDQSYAEKKPFKKCIVHGALLGSYMSALIGTELPGLGTVLVSLCLKFRGAVIIGTQVVTRVEIKSIDTRRSFVKLSCTSSAEGKTVVKGEALVMFLPQQ